MKSFEARHCLLRARVLWERVETPDLYPFALPAVQGLGDLEFHPKLTFFVGENGSGKSTLIEALAAAWGFNAGGGTKNFNFSAFASHSPILMAYPEALIYQIGPRGLDRVDHEDTAHFEVTRSFLNRHEAMLRQLLGPDGEH